MLTRRPTPREYPERYARYVNLVPEQDLVFAMVEQTQFTDAWLLEIDPDRANHRYAPGKWTLREVVGHVLDSERLFGLRLLAVARGDPMPHAAANEELWVRHAEFGRYSLGALADEFMMVRQSHVSMLRHLPAEAWDRVGVLGGAEVSVRALGYIMLGHERHHWNVARTRYVGWQGADSATY